MQVSDVRCVNELMVWILNSQLPQKVKMRGIVSKPQGAMGVVDLVHLL